LLTAEQPTAASYYISIHKLTMKKGKPNVPPAMRGDYKHQQQMAEMRQQMIASSQPGKDGLPVFNLFVRTKKANVCTCIRVERNHFHLLVVVSTSQQRTIFSLSILL
jgi:hypothetical protein